MTYFSYSQTANDNLPEQYKSHYCLFQFYLLLLSPYFRETAVIRFSECLRIGLFTVNHHYDWDFQNIIQVLIISIMTCKLPADPPITINSMFFCDSIALVINDDQAFSRFSGLQSDGNSFQ